jgi:hypothetical protein
MLTVGLGISDKKIIPPKTETKQMVYCSDGILVVPWNRKLSEFHSEPFRIREKCKEFGNDSSVDLGMPRNEHFLPQNRNCSESIPRTFSGMKFWSHPS